MASSRCGEHRTLPEIPLTAGLLGFSGSLDTSKEDYDGRVVPDFEFKTGTLDLRKVRLGPHGLKNENPDTGANQGLKPTGQPEGTTHNWDADKSVWFRDLVRDMKAIRPGTTRGQLDSTLVSDGWTRTAKAHRYQHPQCPFLKLDVFFAIEEDFATESPDDLVVRVAEPIVDLKSNWDRW